MWAALAGESGSISGFPWHLDDYGERGITLPSEVDGHRVRVGCDVADVEDVQNSLAAFGDRYLRKVYTASEIDDCQGRNRAQRLAARFAAKEAVIKAFEAGAR
jgi:holo-[acyl-carrier protein] synthase